MARSPSARERHTDAAMGWPFASSPPAPPPPTATWANYLFLSHAILELVLGAIKLRGRYAHETPSSRSARSAMYVRHHAFSLLALSLLGYFVWRDDAADRCVCAANHGAWQQRQ